MTVLIDPHDPRGPKAVALATEAINARWPSIPAYYMPSRTRSSVVYVTTRAFCTCPAFRYGGDRRCFHSLAAELVDQVRDELAAF